MDIQEVLQRARTALHIHMGDFVAVSSSPYAVVVRHMHQRTATDADHMFTKVELEPYGDQREKILSHSERVNYAIFGTYGSARSELFFLNNEGRDKPAVVDDIFQNHLTRYRLNKIYRENPPVTEQDRTNERLLKELGNCARYVRAPAPGDRDVLAMGKRLLDNIDLICYNRRLRIVTQVNDSVIEEIQRLD